MSIARRPCDEVDLRCRSGHRDSKGIRKIGGVSWESPSGIILCHFRSVSVLGSDIALQLMGETNSGVPMRSTNPPRFPSEVPAEGPGGVPDVFAFSDVAVGSSRFYVSLAFGSFGAALLASSCILSQVFSIFRL